VRCVLWVCLGAGGAQATAVQVDVESAGCAFFVGRVRLRASALLHSHIAKHENVLTVEGAGAGGLEVLAAARDVHLVTTR
jgi:hypothetical protein